MTENIKFVGKRENINKYLSVSKVFILTSKYEGMPVSVLEAKALGLPAVVSDFPDSKSVVKNGFEENKS